MSLTCNSGFCNFTDIASKSGQQEDQGSKTSSEKKATWDEGSIVLREEVQRSERSSRNQQDGTRIFKEWEGLVSESPQAGRAKMCITEVEDETSFSDSAPEFSAGDFSPSTSKGTSGTVLVFLHSVCRGNYICPCLVL